MAALFPRSVSSAVSGLFVVELSWEMSPDPAVSVAGLWKASFPLVQPSRMVLPCSVSVNVNFFTYLLLCSMKSCLTRLLDLTVAFFYMSILIPCSGLVQEQCYCQENTTEHQYRQQHVVVLCSERHAIVSGSRALYRISFYVGVYIGHRRKSV